jgi:uncharacterized protein YigA (DUF484 family)
MAFDPIALLVKSFGIDPNEVKQAITKTQALAIEASARIERLEAKLDEAMRIARTNQALLQELLQERALLSIEKDDTACPQAIQ